MPNTIPGERNFGAFVPEELIESFRQNVRDEGFKLKIVVQRLMEFWLSLDADRRRIFYAGQFNPPSVTDAQGIKRTRNPRRPGV